MDKVDEINTFDKRTIIMVSHNAAHLQYAHRVYYLKDGLVVREVVNPQRKQIKSVKEGETIVTELEQLARLFPYDSVDMLRVRSMVNYLTQELTFDQIVRLERAVLELMKGKIHKKNFVAVLTRSYDEGGVELDRSTAERMADNATKMIAEADDIRRFRNHNKSESAFFEQHKFAERIKEHLVHGHGVRLSEKQEARVSELIADRVTGVADESDFYDILISKDRHLGLGLKVNAADDITRYLEKLIAQGVDVSYKK
jgi:hypothetical protein